MVLQKNGVTKSAGLLLLIILMSILPSRAVPSTYADSHGSTVDVIDYFPEVLGNRSKITWSHAVNSQEKLIQAINGPTMMLEADILMGTTDSSPDELVPIMAHPPNRTSDLSFGGFLRTIVEVTNDFGNKKRKGIKLDFKDMKAVEPVLKILKETHDTHNRTFPVWLNADVLKGPISATIEPLDGPLFIKLAKEYLPDATLSLGWTTRYGRDEINNQPTPTQDSSHQPKLKTGATGYSAQNVEDMIRLITDSGWHGPVTFPVRAGIVATKESKRELPKLKTEIVSLDNPPTFTIWAAKDDPVNMKLLKEWILVEEIHNVYVDLPFDLETGPPSSKSDFLKQTDSAGRWDPLKADENSSGHSGKYNLLVMLFMTFLILFL